MIDRKKLLRLIEAVDVVLENLDDAAENTNESGETYADIKELREAVEAVRS